MHSMKSLVKTDKKKSWLRGYIFISSLYNSHNGKESATNLMSRQIDDRPRLSG